MQRRAPLATPCATRRITASPPTVSELPETATLVRAALPEPLELLHAAFVRHRFAPHAHDTFVIAVVEAGAGRSRYRGGSALYRPGGVVVVEPGEPHDGVPAAPGGWRYRALYPAPTLLARLAGVDALADAVVAGRRLFAASYFPDPALADRLITAHAALATATIARCDTLHAETLLTGALGTLVRRHACAAGVARAAAHASAAGHAARGVRAARALLHDALDHAGAAALSLHALADAAQLTPTQLTRAFRAAVGLPPHAYLERLRVEQAKTRLSRGEPIADVAFATGFADQSHLTRRFRRVVGVTPGAYARACTAPRARRRVA
jgi:AraC-like DNA-binding protein